MALVTPQWKQTLEALKGLVFTMDTIDQKSALNGKL